MEGGNIPSQVRNRQKCSQIVLQTLPPRLHKFVSLLPKGELGRQPSGQIPVKLGQLRLQRVKLVELPLHGPLVNAAALGALRLHVEHEDVEVLAAQVETLVDVRDGDAERGQVRAAVDVVRHSQVDEAEVLGEADFLAVFAERVVDARALHRRRRPHHTLDRVKLLLELPAAPQRARPLELLVLVHVVQARTPERREVLHKFIKLV